MSDYAYPVIRWPFNLAAPENNFTVKKTGGSPQSVNVPVGTYINDGSGSVITPKDFVQALETYLGGAWLLAGGVGTINCALNNEGILTIWISGGSGASLEIINLTSTQLGYLGSASTPIVVLTNGTVKVLDFQMSNQWLPGIDPVFDTGEVERDIVHEDLNLRGEPRVLVLSDGGWIEREIEWERIAAARMLTDRATNADFAYYAEINVGEDNSWENMWAYMRGPVGPLGDNRVYIYSTNDPLTATNEGAYYWIMSRSKPNQDGVPSGGFVRGMAVEQYAVTMSFRKI